MKLQKALDKARENRERRVDKIDENAVKELPSKKNPDKSRWAPPVYSTSVAVPIDPDFVKKNRCVCIEPDSPEVESYKVLRSKIQQQALLHNWRTVLITSPTPGDGKTLTAVNLALTIAKAYDQTVMLVDCDLKRQGVHKILGIDSASGLQNYLVDEMPLERIIVWPGVEKLSFISGGESILESSEVLGSPRMKALVGELKSRYEDRIVLFDAPPILSGSDTLALAPLVDGIVMVVAEGKTSMKDIQQAIEMIPGEKLMGFVMNRQRMGSVAHYYY